MRSNSISNNFNFLLALLRRLWTQCLKNENKLSYVEYIRETGERSLNKHILRLLCLHSVRVI